MSVRPLVIDDAAKAEAARVLAHAEKNHYFPGMTVPGDDPRNVARFGTYRAVFTFTHHLDMVWRHLSVSVPGPKFPNPVAVFHIAQMFGFTGYEPEKRAPDMPPQDWAIDLNESEHCVSCMQPVAADVGPGKRH